VIEPNVVERFRVVAARHPSKVAVEGAEHSLTYGELDDLSNRVAMALVTRGIRPGHRVGLHFEREPRLLVALLGVLKSGAGVAPLMPSLPVDRLRQIVDDAELQLLLTPGNQSTDPDLGVAAVALDVCLAFDRDFALPIIDAESLASILYTSGTTGDSRGVPQSHRLLFRKTQRTNQVLRLDPADRVTAFSTPAMSQGLTPVILTLLTGATSCPFDIRREGLTRAASWMESGRVTVWYSSVTLLRTLARSVGPARGFPRVRLVRVGGERVVPGDIAAARRLFPSAQIVVPYATTETGTICVHRVQNGETYANGIVPIGTPIEGVTLRIVDEQDVDVPVGCEGEIAVQSADISFGYWCSPELSAARFAMVPGHPGERLYRTGDLGRQRADGQFEHLGRKDLRVKIRGFRIEIEEIETVLMQQPEIVRAVVAAKPGVEGDPRLVAYVQLTAESETTVEALRVELGRRLADYMIPSTFVFVDEIPLTDSGKIARQRLPDPPPARPILAAGYVGPRSPREKTIAGVWREVLGLTEVGIHDAFYSVGGDSLKATLIASRLTARLGLNVPLATLLEASTIAEKFWELYRARDVVSVTI